jgi:ABC-type transport system substrate-binding protein
MRKIQYIFLALILLSGLLLGGCQIGESPPSATGGGTLHLYGIDPLTLDPAISGETTSHQYVMQLFSGLVCLGDDLQPAPDIARKWAVSNEGRTYTFYLNKDVSFHDGREVKAQDFK